MSMLLRQQLAFMRSANFDFNAGFLDRMVTSAIEFINADGHTSAGPSAGVSTEIVENHALITEILEGARAFTSDEDQSRASGIARLEQQLHALETFCRKTRGVTVERLAALLIKPDLFDADLLNRTAGVLEEYVRAVDRHLAVGGASPGDERSQFDFAEDVIAQALASPIHDDPNKAAAIARLNAVRDDLREMLP